MITVSSASLSFIQETSTNPVINDISFKVETHSSCAIIGPSGCGKTSLLFMLAGLRTPTSGSISIEGEPRCGTILQNYGLFPWKTVSQNIGLGLVLEKKEKTLIKRRTAQLIAEMGLTGFDDYYPIQLSGGMQQRVALARALAVEPEILLMDEPLSSLDALTRERLQNLVVDICRTKRITAVIVTHSIEEAVFIGRKIIILSERPSRVLATVDNPEAGKANYRRNPLFHERCTHLRKILQGDDGEKA
ncbi:MAG: ABC transporter ATP-binding protein [Proteobacteria bacterium]|nr:MAG: ABC transporter ATP-binding protein [Pseudomonadota bacterium]PIE64683.1 MAG: ABC transporter ATP-binding protein [Desulfobacterales bacterium]